MVGSLDCKNID